MIPYIISLREQNTVIQGQVAGEASKNQRTKAQVGRMQHDVEATKQDLAATKDTTKRVDPKITRLNQALDAAASDLGSRVATVKDTLRQTTSQLSSVGIKADQALANTVSLSSDLGLAKQQLQNQVGRVSETADQALNNTVALSSDLDGAKRQLQGQVNTLLGDVDLVEEQVRTAQANIQQVQGQIGTLSAGVCDACETAQSAQSTAQGVNNQVQAHLGLHDTSLLRFSEALSGNLKLYAEAITANLSAAALNAAAAGTFTRELTVSLVSELGEGESTVRYTHPWALLPVVITAEASADPDIDPPTVEDYDDPEATPQFQAGLLHLKVIMDTDAGVTKTYAPNDTLTVTVKTSADSKLLGWPVADFVMTYTVIA